MTFAPYGSNGIIFLAANSLNSPDRYLAVYMQDGNISLRIASPVATLEVTTQEQFSDGQKYTIDLLVYGHMLILTENVKKSYVTNGGDPGQDPVLIDIQEVVIGGILPTTDRNKLSFLPVNQFFKGAIHEVTVKTYGAQSQTYPITQPSNAAEGITAVNIGPVPSSITYGVSLSGANSYLNLGLNGRTVVQELTVEISLSNVKPSVLLFYVWEGQNRFIAMDIMQYKVRALIGYGGATAFTANSSDTTNFCDGNTHVYRLKVNTSAVEIQIDDNGSKVVPFPPGVTFPVIVNGMTIVGGMYNPPNIFQTTVSSEAVEGCINSISIDGTVYDPTQYLSGSSGTALTCPA